MGDKTASIIKWMDELNDSDKLKFAINWKMPHTLFNVASKIYKGDKEDLQDVDWYSIYTRKDLGVWSHGGKVSFL